jgi:hypothetical protein
MTVAIHIETDGLNDNSLWERNLIIHRTRESLLEGRF